MKHVLIVDEPAGGQVVVLESSTYLIGREPVCTIVLTAACVSRQHASLIRINRADGYHYRIFDGNSKGKLSTNGLIINGTKVPSWDLRDGDAIKFGEFTTATYRIATASEVAELTSGDRPSDVEPSHSKDATIYFQ